MQTLSPSREEQSATSSSTLPYTKVVATIGPASEDRLEELIDAGMSVARLNFSHGTEEEHRRRVGLLRNASKRTMRPVGLLADLQGPKMRMGLFPEGAVQVASGQALVLRQGAGMAEPGEANLNFKGFLEAVEVGHRVILADGLVQLVAREKHEDHIVAEVQRGGSLGDRKGVHLPDSKIAYDLPTPEDLVHIELAKELGVDFLGVSFVGHPEEVRRIRSLAPGVQIVSKIERKVALENLTGLLAVSDGVMVARGDLGVELDLERLPLVQKMILQESLKAGRFTITATEMLESMIEHSRPTRAEVTDVANAIFDGTDAIMLSAETAVGAYPVEAVSVMARVSAEVEHSRRYHDLPRAAFRAAESSFSNATALAAVQAAEALGITKIVAFTETGNTVRLLARYRPSAEIIGLSPIDSTVGQMSVLSHVRPLQFPRESSLEEMLYVASEMLVVRGMAHYGEPIVFVAGVPPGISRTTNVMKLHRIGEDARLH